MSETTHMICARCGTDNVFSNEPLLAESTISPIVVTIGVSRVGLLFSCLNGCTYPLPFTLPEKKGVN